MAKTKEEQKHFDSFVKIYFDYELDYDSLKEKPDYRFIPEGRNIGCEHTSVYSDLKNKKRTPHKHHFSIITLMNGFVSDCIRKIFHLM